MHKTLTQNKIDKLDKIGQECGYELHMPPFKGQPHPFFTLKDILSTALILSKCFDKFFTSIIFSILESIFHL